MTFGERPGRSAEVTPRIIEWRIKHLTIPMLKTYRSAIAQRTRKSLLLIEIEDESGLVGYAECSARPDPYYSSEYIGAIEHTLMEYLLPSIPAHSATATEAAEAMKTVRGWPFAKDAATAALEDLSERGAQFSDHSLEFIPLATISLSQTAHTLESDLSRCL